ncbi:hypothetical protein OS493_014980 [Desmophyllum pertusum]|uniref:Uncharacterized protein n=1 Tax=Desmophyllum pertusum TaxID=174260 RepID=A0A9X0A245_9CNID|nr:hypothetical protein OS493_014980 [Desmophyllum pertusum]
MEERSESDVDERVPTHPLKLQMSPPYGRLEQEKDETSFNRALWSPSYRIDLLRLSSESDDCLSPSSRQISHSSEDETRSVYNENLVSDDRSHRFDLFRISSSDSDDCADLLSPKLLRTNARNKHNGKTKMESVKRRIQMSQNLASSTNIHEEDTRGSGSAEEEHRKGGKSSTKDGQKNYRNCREKYREKSQDINSSIPCLPKICQPKQRIQSRDQVGSSSRMASWDMAPKAWGPRRSPRSHAAKQSTSTSLGEISGRSLGKTETRNASVYQQFQLDM